MAALSEADARDLLTLAARNIAKRRAMLEALETAAKEARETVANAEESAADARALDSFDSFSTEFVSTLAGILKRPAVERQEAFVSLQIDATGSDPLNLLRAPRAERLTAAALLLMSMLQGRSYDARERALFRDCSFDLGLKAAQLPELERKVALRILEAPQPMEPSESFSEKSLETDSTWTLPKAGLTIAGGLAIAAGGAIAAPLVGAGVGAVLSGIGLGGPFAGLAVLAGNPGLMAGIFGYTGALKAKEMIEHASADVADFEFLSIENVASPDIGSPVDPLHTTICIAGFLRRPEDVANCFSVIPNVENAHALRYDPDALLAVGRIAQDTLSNSVRGIVQGEILKRTVFSTLMYSLWPLALLQTAAILDNPFSHALSISKKAGMHLAHTLMGRKQGPGPVSIIATSLGASVAFQCLKELDSQGAYGLVDTVVLLGSPVPTSKLDWIAARRAVAGRLINVYSTEDYLLAFLFRVVGLSLGCAGVHAVDVPGVENLDVTHIVGVWHGGYQDHLGIILRGLGFNVVDSEVERQEEVSEPPEFMSDSPMDLNLAPGARENQVVPAVVVSDAERKRQRRRGHGSDEENGDAQELRVWTRRKMD